MTEQRDGVRGTRSPGAGPRIVVVGAGFAGFHAARRLSRLLGDRAEIVVVSPSDYFLYVPLIPEVAGGILDPRDVAVPLTTALRGTRLLLGSVEGANLAERQLSVVDADGRQSRLTYDRLVLTPGSVNKLLPIPGISEHAHGFRSIAEALYLRDHWIAQLELADASTDAADRSARCTFVVVGAGYTGTEVAAQGQLLTRRVARNRAGLGDQPIRWVLVDIADRVLPSLDLRLSRAADRVLRRRGVEIRTETSVKEATADGVTLSDGEFVPTRTLVWCVGVRPDTLVDQLGLPTKEGRVEVDEHLSVPSHPEVFAAGDCAAVPDLTQPGNLTPMTAQHAERQGHLAAHNVAASLGHGEYRPYKHHDLGFVVDLAGFAAAANPLGYPLSGPLAKLLARAYHVANIPQNRRRIAADWLLDTIAGRRLQRLGLVSTAKVQLNTDPHGPGS